MKRSPHYVTKRPMRDNKTTVIVGMGFIVLFCLTIVMFWYQNNR